MLIDTHCHLTDPALANQHAFVLARAAQAGVRRMITVATSPTDWDAALAMVAGDDALYMAAGLHPHKADQMAPGIMERLEGVLVAPKVVAVGETGLEYHYDFSPRDKQRQAFAAQLELAKRLAKPVIVHSRESMADTLAILDEHAMADQRVVFHCFTGTAADAEQILQRGWYISLAGVVTFKNAGPLQEAAKLVPPDKLLLETDSPYLTPEPLRRIRPNEPAYITHTARFLANLRGVAFEEFAAICWQNAQRLFRLDAAAT